MSKLTVVVKSCQRDKRLGFHDAIRFTWGKDLAALGVDVIFAMGGPGYDHVSDEVNFPDCPDGYMDLPEKTRRICNWAFLKRWGHIFLCDTDTLVRADKLVALPWQDADYAGGFKGGQAEVGKQFFYRDAFMMGSELWPWASGGYGYFLSPRAQAAVAIYPLVVWAEDMQVGQALGPCKEMKIVALPMTKTTIHLPKQNWSPEIIKKVYHELR